MQFCTASMSAIMTFTKHGAITHTHAHARACTDTHVLANMADMEAVQNYTTAGDEPLKNSLNFNTGG